MPFRILLVIVSFAFITACSSDDASDLGKPANIELNGLGEDGVSSGELGALGEHVAGSQEELVANVGDRVFFNFNSSSLDDAGQRTLQRQAEWLSKNPKVNIIVEGHCDERGTREFNLALGERRAQAVKSYLVSLNVAANRISVISYGKEYPEFLESNETAWSKNRRAVSVVNNQ